MTKNLVGCVVIGLLTSVGCGDASDGGTTGGPTTNSGGSSGSGGSTTGATGGTGGGTTGATGGTGGNATTTGSAGAGGDAGGSAGMGGEVGCTEPPATGSDLFTCGQSLSCPALCSHIDYGDCSSAEVLLCSQELLASGDAGLLQVEGRPGPGNVQGDTLTLFLPDGGAIVQRRLRSCAQLPCDFDAIPWQVYQQELCDVLPYQSCEDCDPYPLTVNCAPLVHEASCDNLGQVLGGDPELDLAEAEACDNSPDLDCSSNYEVVLTADDWPADSYQVDLTFEAAHLLCSVEVVVLSSARATAPGDDGGSAGAGGAAGAETTKRYAYGRACDVLTGGGSDILPSFSFDEGLVMRVNTLQSAELKLLRDDNEVFSTSVAPNDVCQATSISVTGL